MLTVLHAADFHLDAPFRALSPQEAQRRRAGLRQGVERLAELARAAGADLALLAGDLLDSQQPYPETLEALPRALGRFPCPVVIAPGNHDYYAPASPYARPIWPENVHIFTTQTVASLPFSALGVTVYGCAFTSPAREDDPLAGFTAPRDGTLALGVFHGEVDSRGGQYAPIAPESLAHSGLAYAALGHVHAPRLCPDAPAPWAYSGCLQGRGFDELGEKGCCLVTLDEGGVRDLAFRPIPGPRYYERSLDLTGLDPAEAVRAALDGVGVEDTLRLTLTGEAEALDLPALERLGAGVCATLELRDETRPPRDPWARLEEDTLTGHFLREMARRLETAAPAERPRLERALTYGLAALEGREAPR